jgi:hypothetical protein
VIQFRQNSPPLFAALARSPDQPPLEQQEESMDTDTIGAMSDRSSVVLWVLSCIVLWALVARDPITVMFCLAVTVPYTVMLIRESREHKAMQSS